MKKATFILTFLLISVYANAQIIYETFQSVKLNDTRDIKIQLPRGYYNNMDKSYPVCVVLDGDYLFEAVAGNVDYFSYWEDMPDAIVIGINQAEKRFEDCYYSKENAFPADKGAAFFEFLGMELMPFIDKNYRTQDFRVAFGHGLTANFINYYLLKPQSLFHAYVVMSPELAPEMASYIPERLSNIDTKIFYYLATSDQDVNFIKEGTKALQKNMAAIENQNLLFEYDEFKDATHYALPTHAIPNALESIFFVYQPISKKEFNDVIVQLQSSPVDYLTEKYTTIKELFGIEKPILINDFKAIAASIERNGTFEYYEALGKLARKEYPDTLLGNYYLARFYEENNDPKKAMKTYRSAYILQETAGLTKDMMLEKAESIKADFGYN
ncbi:alpha/beta hydrolase [Mangrovimonas aestuarii]|uniref:alpha/beta hydrolase n=1 Tax=Mangrovimonas aestuarii TaxID=3018443 RepID=UPI0023793225|nr:alpha/beta hydrolase-fold protein [Mangrovimonas aestuarii]